MTKASVLYRMGKNLPRRGRRRSFFSGPRVSRFTTVHTSGRALYSLSSYSYALNGTIHFGVMIGFEISSLLYISDLRMKCL